MKQIKILSVLSSIILLMVFASCNKNDNPEPTGNKRMSQLAVSPNFNWEATKVININIQVDIPAMTGSLAKITIYDGNPFENGNILASGSAGQGFAYTTGLRIPSRLTQVYAEYRDAKGGYQLTSLSTAGSSLNHVFSGELKNGGFKSSLTEPDCTSGCDQVISGSGSVTITGGQTYCVTDNFNGTVSFAWWNGGGTLKVCGTANIGSTTLGNNCAIVVTAGGSFTASSISMSGTGNFSAYSNTTVTIATMNMQMASTTLTNYSGDFTITSEFVPNGTVNNHGTLNINNNYRVNSTALNNTGTVNVSGYFEVNAALTNDGTIEVTGDITINGSGKSKVNNCKIITHNDFHINSTGFTSNNGYLKAYNNLNVNSSASPVLNNQSMWSVKNLIVNSGPVTGNGSLNTIRTENGVTFWSNGSASGAIEIADNDAVITGNQNAMVNGATIVTYANATNYIPVSGCNPEGIGTPSIVDTDGDGVPDNLDDYPTDPTRAFNNFYPNNNTWSSLAYEDLWPSKGDYDFNDLVTNYQFNLVTNAQNKVVDIKAQFHVKAVGASFKNGFGLQIDGLTPNMVASATGMVLQESYINLSANGLEANQAKAVVIPWDNVDHVIHRAGGSMFNTILNGFVGTADTVSIHILLGVPQNTSVVGTPPFNPFLIRQMNRGHEIHLADHVPTSLADLSLFNTESDASNPAAGKYYVTATNLPWGINVPEPFVWPLEKIEITEGHLHFAEWAESSGSLYPDWYQDKPGYRDNSKLYLP